jgi:hypothetical protein
MQQLSDISIPVEGRGTDLLIHRQVMGWKKLRIGRLSSWYRPGKLGPEFRKDVPPYSTKLIAAFLVVDEMEKQGWTFSLTEQIGEASGGAVTRVRFIKPDVFVEWTDVLRAAAICYAALKTVGPPH